MVVERLLVGGSISHRRKDSENQSRGNTEIRFSNIQEPKLRAFEWADLRAAVPPLVAIGGLVLAFGPLISTGPIEVGRSIQSESATPRRTPRFWASDREGRGNS
jgi:hypothetical protein